MIPVFKWTLWQRRWSVLVWSIAIVAFIALNILLYPAVRDQAAQLNQFLERMPETTRALFTDSAEPLSPTGYLSTRLFYLLLPLLFGVLAIGLGSSLLAKEESDNTIELLLARRLSRLRLLLGKAFAGLAVLGVVGGIAVVATVFFSWVVEIDVELQNVALTSLMMLALSTLLGAVAFFVSSLGRWGRPASIGIAVFVAIGGYLFTSLSSIASWLEWPARALPYHYYHPGDILVGNFSYTNLLLLLAASLILGTLSWLAFRRRDISP